MSLRSNVFFTKPQPSEEGYGTERLLVVIIIFQHICTVVQYDGHINTAEYVHMLLVLNSNLQADCWKFRERNLTEVKLAQYSKYQPFN